MGGNRGRTSLRGKRRAEDPMREFDRLPPDLRAWLAAATLPWRPRSVRRAYDKALAETGDRTRALLRLTALQGRLVARDAAVVWGPDHPAAQAAPVAGDALQDAAFAPAARDAAPARPGRGP